MTSFAGYGERTRDVQDGFERHVWGKLEYVNGKGSVIKVRGTGSKDEEAPVMNLGYGFNMAENSNTEVFLLSGGSDTNMKFAITTIPFDKQRKWKEGTGGVQNPTDPEKALEFNAKRAHVTDKNFAVGDGLFEVKDGKVYIRADVVITGKATVNGNVVTPTVTAGTEAVGGFDP